jgi:OOP family OmpA-OmpF porin
MNKILIFICFLWLSLLDANHDYTYQTTMYFGQNNFDSASTLDESKIVYGIRGTKYIDSWQGIQLGYERMDTIPNKDHSSYIDLQRVYSNIIFDGVIEDYDILPYLLVGLGYESLDKESENEVSQTFGQLGVGFKYSINSYLNVALEFRALKKFRTDDLDFISTLGFALMLDEDFKLAKHVDREIVQERFSLHVRDMPKSFQVIKDMQECEDSHDPYCYKVYKLNILFDYDKADIKDGYYYDLQQVAEVLRLKPNYKLIVEGHTDNIGSDRYNKVLSQKRANALKSYLSDAGIDSSRVKAIGYGESSPIASNKDEEGRSQNRRVMAKFMVQDFTTYK